MLDGVKLLSNLSLSDSVKKIVAEDSLMLKRVDELIGFGMGNLTSAFEEKEKFRKFSFAIPNVEVVRFIASYSPIVEMGAGTGMWAYLISKAGGGIRAFDIAPLNGAGCQNEYEQMEYHFGNVEVGSTEVLADFSSSTLFLCWPPYDDPMAFNALKSFSGGRLIFIGEGWGGCTGDDSFFELLDKEWKEERIPDGISIQRMSGLNDHIRMWTRIGRNVPDSVMKSRSISLEDDE